MHTHTHTHTHTHARTHARTHTHTQDGTMDEEKVSELCQAYSERFHIEPAQIMETARDICGAAATKVSLIFYSTQWI